MIGKYSPTVWTAYQLDQKWHEKQRGDDLYDRDGYDSYGYNKDGKDRAGYTDWDYASNEDLYETVRSQTWLKPERA